MTQSNHSLRFGCPACGTRLVVEQSLAGTEGPCPLCGARIVAPPVEVATTLTRKQAAPIPVRPRSARDVGMVSSPPAEPEPLSKSRAMGASTRFDSPGSPRAVSPTTIMSERHQEKKNTVVFVKMIIAAAVAAAVAIAVFYILAGVK